jgi:hypothetical protein
MFLKLLERLGRKRVIYDRVRNEPYLERYYLFLKERERFPFNIFLHKFLKGDPGDVHDHPWSYATLILKGGYYEWIPQFDSEGKLSCEIRKWRGAGHFRICRPESYHRIELKDGVTAWTLFMPGSHKQDWGFLVNDQWVQNDQYLKERYEQAHNQSYRA